MMAPSITLGPTILALGFAFATLAPAAVPASTASAPREGTAAQRLVQEGLVAVEFLEAARVQTADVAAPSWDGLRFDFGGAQAGPAAGGPLPPAPDERGCTGLQGTYGAVVDADAHAPFDCPLERQMGAPWVAALSCLDAADFGVTACYSVGISDNWFNFGIVQIVCWPQAPAGAAVHVLPLPSQTQAQTLECSIWSFGAHPGTWFSWLGFCGAFGTVGAWRCSWIV